MAYFILGLILPLLLTGTNKLGLKERVISYLYLSITILILFIIF